MKISEWHNKQLAESTGYAEAAREIDLAETIADVIVAGRVRAGWTQEELAKRADLTQAQVSTLESGLGNPKIATVEKALGALRQAGDVDFAPIAEAMAGAGSDDTAGVVMEASAFTFTADASAFIEHTYSSIIVSNQLPGATAVLGPLAANSNLAMAA